jgi:hypothetical protein
MGSLIVLAGVSAVIYAILFIRLPARRTFSWPSVRGTVTHSAVKERWGGTGPGNPNTVYEADVRYRYSVNGREYKSSTLRRGGNLALSVAGRAEAVAGRYPEGDDVDVYYNPANARESCLQPGEEVSAFIIGVGLIFCVVGWFMA